MSDSHSGVLNVKVIPPLVYIAGVVIGIVISIWIPTKIVSSSLAWMLGGLLIVCGAILTGSAILKFKGVGTTGPTGSPVIRCISDSLWFMLALHWQINLFGHSSFCPLYWVSYSVKQSNRRRHSWKDVSAPTTSGIKKTSGVGYNAFRTASAAMSAIGTKRTLASC